MEPRDTLLLVDDQQADRAVLRELFQEEYNLLEAENGDQALLLLEENHTRIAAVLLDLLMPAKDGFTVLAEMRAKRVLPETPVVVITAQDSAARAARAFELGASDFIVKPFEPCAVRRRGAICIPAHGGAMFLRILSRGRALAARGGTIYPYQHQRRPSAWFTEIFRT